MSDVRSLFRRTHYRTLIECRICDMGDLFARPDQKRGFRLAFVACHGICNQHRHNSFIGVFGANRMSKVLKLSNGYGTLVEDLGQENNTISVFIKFKKADNRKNGESGKYR